MLWRIGWSRRTAKGERPFRIRFSTLMPGWAIGLSPGCGDWVGNGLPRKARAFRPRRNASRGSPRRSTRYSTKERGAWAPFVPASKRHLRDSRSQRLSLSSRSAPGTSVHAPEIASAALLDRQRRAIWASHGPLAQVAESVVVTWTTPNTCRLTITSRSDISRSSQRTPRAQLGPRPSAHLGLDRDVKQAIAVAVAVRCSRRSWWPPRAISWSRTRNHCRKMPRRAGYRPIRESRQTNHGVNRLRTYLPCIEVKVLTPSEATFSNDSAISDGVPAITCWISVNVNTSAGANAARTSP